MNHHHLFAGGGFEVLQELPICNTKIGSQQKLLENGLGGLAHTGSHGEKRSIFEGQLNEVRCTPSLISLGRFKSHPFGCAQTNLCVLLVNWKSQYLWP